MTESEFLSGRIAEGHLSNSAPAIEAATKKKGGKKRGGKALPVPTRITCNRSGKPGKPGRPAKKK